RTRHLRLPPPLPKRHAARDVLPGGRTERHHRRIVSLDLARSTVSLQPRRHRRRDGRVASVDVEACGSLIERRLVPALGTTRLAALRIGRCRDFRQGLEAEGLSGKTVTNILGLLHKAMADAVEERCPPRQPGTAARPSKPPRAGAAVKLRPARARRGEGVPRRRSGRVPRPLRGVVSDLLAPPRPFPPPPPLAS